jgi:hypothetical protein
MASARLFSVVDRRGTRFEVTERGHHILSGIEPSACSARREAFLAVPLFRIVADELDRSAATLLEDLAVWLVAECGEVQARAPGVARQLVSSARQAGLLATDSDGNLQFRTSMARFTSVDNQPSHAGHLNYDGRGAIDRSERWVVPWARTDCGSISRTVENLYDTRSDAGDHWWLLARLSPSSWLRPSLWWSPELLRGVRPPITTVSASRWGMDRPSTRCCLRSVPPRIAEASTSPMTFRARLRRRRRRPPPRPPCAALSGCRCRQGSRRDSLAPGASPLAGWSTEVLEVPTPRLLRCPSQPEVSHLSEPMDPAGSSLGDQRRR